MAIMPECYANSATYADYLVVEDPVEKPLCFDGIADLRSADALGA